MAIEKEIATGKYSIHMVGDDEQHNIKIEDGNIYYRGVPFLGVALVRVLAPQTLFVPALNCLVNGNNIGTLCLRCAINASKKGTGGYTKCRHNEQSRSFTSTYSSIEIAYAAGLGYTFHFFELAIFERSEKLLKLFTLALIYEQMLVSPYPVQCESVAKKQLHLDCINNSLKFEEHLGKKLTLSNVKPNAGLNKLRKLILNSFIGYFNLDLHEATNTSFVSNYTELAKKINAGNVKDIESFGDIIQITTEANKHNMGRSQLKTNVMVSLKLKFYHSRKKENIFLGWHTDHQLCANIYS